MGKKRTPAAKAGPGGVIYGTAEVVPFLKTEFPRKLFTRGIRLKTRSHGPAFFRSL